MNFQRRDINYKVLENMLENQAILSIGCGSAELEKEIKKLGNEVSGIDIDEKAVLDARSKIDMVLRIDIEKEDEWAFLKKNSFDVVIVVDVLEHLLNPSLVLKKIKLYLKPGGYIVVSLPNIANWKTRFGLLFGRFNYDNYGVLDRTHLKFYTFNTAKRLINDAGFKIRKVDFTTNLLNSYYECWLGCFGRRQPKIQPNTSGHSEPASNSTLRKLIRRFLENIDYSLVKICKGLFAFQIILVAYDDKSND